MATRTATGAGRFTPIPQSAKAPNMPAGLDLEATPTLDAMAATISEGGLVFTGPLTHPKQVALYRAALGYATQSVEESLREAKAINGVGYGDPSNICGPLAIAILRDADIIAPLTVPHDFWLLDPRTPTDKAKLEATFPAGAFDHTKISTAINKVDWLTSPLEPGDFLFIWHGTGGNFDHMLVVSRVDREQRAYAVTNFGTTDGYVIAEAVLYDPHDPAAGLFHTWTKEQDAILGSTGFGGYEIWRARGP